MRGPVHGAVSCSYIYHASTRSARSASVAGLLRVERRRERVEVYQLLVVHAPHALLTLGRALAAVLGARRRRPPRLQRVAAGGRVLEMTLATKPPPACAADARGGSLRSTPR